MLATERVAEKSVGIKVRPAMSASLWIAAPGKILRIAGIVFMMVS
jgi:hypothetical protein